MANKPASFDIPTSPRILSEDVAEQRSRKQLRSYNKKMLSSNMLQIPVHEKIKQLWNQHGQGHVFNFEDSLTDSEKQLLYRQLEQLDVASMKNIYERALETDKELTEGKPDVRGLDTTHLKDATPEELQRWSNLGYQLIGEGKVAALVLAGGQGSRLGSSLPKGMYDISLPSHKSLFQVHAERIVKMQQLVAIREKKEKVNIPLYVMTSAATHKSTKEFFKTHDFFGLDENNVRFFRQGTLPAMDFNGKLILESKSQVFVAPDGNGGLYKALRDKGILSEMKEKGIEWVSQYCVDNVLSKLVDPVFIGFTAEKKALIGCKAVRKTDPGEKTGVIALKNNKPTVVEYSEITKEMAQKRDQNNNLDLRAGHICVNLFHYDFLEKAGVEYLTKFHIARKKIPTVNDKGEIETPTKENGMKFEQFIFDPWEYVSNLVVLEVPREEEFAALKNPPGSSSDSPDTSRVALSNLHKSWIEKAGGLIIHSETEDSLCEISPLISLDGENLEKLVNGQSFRMPFELGIHPITKRIVVTNWTHLG